MVFHHNTVQLVDTGLHVSDNRGHLDVIIDFMPYRTSVLHHQLFPNCFSNPTLHRVWVEFVRRHRKNWQPTPTSSLYSIHFEESSFSVNKEIARQLGIKISLKPDAIPMIDVAVRPKESADVSERNRRMTLVDTLDDDSLRDGDTCDEKQQTINAMRRSLWYYKQKLTKLNEQNRSPVDEDHLDDMSTFHEEMKEELHNYAQVIDAADDITDTDWSSCEEDIPEDGCGTNSSIRYLKHDSIWVYGFMQHFTEDIFCTPEKIIISVHFKGLETLSCSADGEGSSHRRSCMVRGWTF
eukprot:gene8578-9495_t